MPVTEADLKKIALSFPEAHEKPSYGQPAFFVAKKFFMRLRKEDASLVWIVDSIDERDALLEMDPGTYFITDHYKNYPSVLVRIARIDKTMLRKMLERRWRAIAPKKLLKAMEVPAPKALLKITSPALRGRGRLERSESQVRGRRPIGSPHPAKTKA